MSRLFGTDGIRGRFGEGFFTEPHLKLFAKSLALFLKSYQKEKTPLVLIGRDTRLSGPLIESILTTALQEAGFPVLSLNVLPTPALAYLTKAHQAILGLMVSASHNPYEDNGIKFFNGEGDKLDNESERCLEALYTHTLHTETSGHTGDPFETSFSLPSSPHEALELYETFLHQTLPIHFTLSPLKIVVDCAHGAAFQVAPRLLQALGATVFPLSSSPNGQNINDTCGALHPQALQRAVQDCQADWGIAFDGDADRLLLVDPASRILDGEQLLAFLAIHWRREGRLPFPEIVSTVMANGAFETFLKTHELTLWRTAVGDRSITEKLIERQLPLGGEPSGHLILRNFHPCGDALLAALHVLRLVSEADQHASHIFPLFSPLPQILHNLALPSRDILEKSSVQAFLSEIQATLQEKGGRLLVRLSGTEPLVRILVEGDNMPFLQSTTHQIVSFLQKA